MDIFSQFGVQPVLLAAQVVNFLILLFILKKFLFGPISKVLEERKTKIADSIKNAQDIEKRLLALSEEEEKRISKAVAEGEKIIKQATEAGQQMMEEAKRKQEVMITQAAEDVKALHQTEKEKMMKEVKENLSVLVLSVLQKVTGKVINKKDQMEMIDKTVKQMD